MDQTELKTIAKHFAIQGEPGDLQAYGSGHIHETYRLKNKKAEQPDYILQKINNAIFTNVDALMHNIETVIKHLHQKGESQNSGDSAKETLSLVRTNDGKSYYQHADGSYWRMYLFLKGTKGYDLIENAKQALEGGRAYGLFIADLSDLDPSKIHEILPDFHNIEHRLNQLDSAIASNPVDRIKDLASEVEFVKERADRMKTIKQLGDAGKLPLRITHNDTKFNNVLLNENDEAHCVIDLDTIMPGYVAYDFGDAVRTIINTAEEDEQDLEKIQLNMGLFTAFAEGFIEKTQAILTENEVYSLSQSCLLLPYIMGVRFLTDYIDGDHYYKIHSPHHNLQRARAQFELVRKLEGKFDELQQTIDHISEKTKQNLCN
jgi:Ser/Thr protein kinase RdoA (MazF antagonist)